MTGPTDPDRQFALAHVPVSLRPAVSALWMLDETLGRIPMSTTQPMIGQMRLTWWYDAIKSLKSCDLRRHPELDALARDVISKHTCIDGDALLPLIEGWEVLLDPLPLPDSALQAFACQRGTQLFTLTARILDVTCPDTAGAGWALADFGGRCSDAATAARALRMADGYLRQVDVRSLPRALRILVRLARHDVATGHRTPRTRWKLLRSIA